MVAVCEDRPAAAHDLVERAGHAHFEALHRAAQRQFVRRLDDEVGVVPLDREVHEAEAEALAAFGKGAADGAEATMAAQVPDFEAHAHGHVNRRLAEPGPGAVWHIGAR